MNDSDNVRDLLDKRWDEFVSDVKEMHQKFTNVTIRLQQTLVKLKAAVNLHGFPYGYSDKRE